MTAEVVARSRARERNARAAITSLGLLAFAVLCLYLVFGGVHLASRTSTARPLRPTHRAAAARVLERTSTTAAATTTTTLVPETFTIATDPVTTPPVTGTPPIAPIATTVPPPPTTTIATTTTTIPSVTASVKVTDSPNWCTVVVTLSTGEQGTYDLAPYLAAPGDSYLFDATLGKYTVHVNTSVALHNGTLQCTSTASTPTRA